MQQRQYRLYYTVLNYLFINVSRNQHGPVEAEQTETCFYLIQSNFYKRTNGHPELRIIPLILFSTHFPIRSMKKTMNSLYKPIYFITIFDLISFIACLSPTSNHHFCLGPGNDTATASYKSDLTVLLDYMSSNASDKSFYNDSLNGIYSLFLCRGDVSSDVCRVCVSNATQTIMQTCPSDKRAIIWYDQCLLRYSNINFLGQLQLYPRLLMWNALNNTSPEEGDIGTRGLLYSLVSQAPYKENMFETNEMVVGNGPGRRYGLVQCSGDLDVGGCSTCLRELLNQTEDCCIGRRGWQILTPSCRIRYEMYSFYERTSGLPGSTPENGGKPNRLNYLIILSP